MTSGNLTKLIENNLLDDAEKPRNYIGASSIGSECMRQVWYGYKNYPLEPLSPRIKRILATGKLLEGMVIGLLEKAGLNVTRTWWDLKDDDLAYFQGHVDCVWLHSPSGDPIAIIEIKTAKASMFNQFKNHGLRAWSPMYYAQVQAYMGMSGIHEAHVIVMNKDNCDLWDECVKFDSMYYEELKMRATMINETKIPPPKVSNNPSWYLCKMCKFRKECHK